MSPLVEHRTFDPPPYTYIVVLDTLCGCRQERPWYGFPPEEILVPIPRAPSFDEAGGPDTLRTRRFRVRFADHGARTVRYEEEPEP